MSSLCLAFFRSYPPRRSDHAEPQRGFADQGEMHTFYLQFALAGCGQSVALSGTSRMWLPGKASLQTHTHMCAHAEKNCTTHLRRFACHTDLFKHSDVFHFAGLEFRMYHTDRHTAYPEYCLSVSHSVSSLLPLILFIIFFSSTYNRRDPSKTPPF